MTEDIIVLLPFFSFADGSQSHHHDIHCHGCPGRHLLPSLQTVQGETAESEGVNTLTSDSYRESSQTSSSVRCPGKCWLMSSKVSHYESGLNNHYSSTGLMMNIPLAFNFGSFRLVQSVDVNEAVKVRCNHMLLSAHLQSIPSPLYLNIIVALCR